MKSVVCNGELVQVDRKWMCLICLSDVGCRKLLFHIYPDPLPLIPSAGPDPCKVIEKEPKFDKNHLEAYLLESSSSKRPCANLEN